MQFLLLVLVFPGFRGTSIKPSLFERPESADIQDVLPKTRYGVTSALPKPVLDRIHRYAGEGRVPLVRYDNGICSLLAVADWQSPVVVLRSTRDKFSAMRSAALTEWTRAVRRQAREV